MSEIVFILGAGASKDAGAPLMAEFLDKAEEIRKQKDLGDSKTDFDLVFDAISAMQIIHSKSDIDLDNIESVFATFEMARLLGRLPGSLTANVESLTVSMRRLISKTLERTVTFPVSGKKINPPTYYHHFAELVGKLNEGGQKRCSIITFNYDIALDYALHFISIPPDYCLSKGSGTTPLLKLHGSLNWAGCSKCNEVIPWTINEFFLKFQFPFLMDVKKVRLDFASELRSSDLIHCGVKVIGEPVIIPPTWNKTEYHQILETVWRRAAKELSEAENVFVLGYSLPESDLFFRYLFALGCAGPTRIKRFWVFNPDQAVKDRFERLLGTGVKGRFRFESVPFNQALGILNNVLLSKE